MKYGEIVLQWTAAQNMHNDVPSSAIYFHQESTVNNTRVTWQSISCFFEVHRLLVSIFYVKRQTTLVVSAGALPSESSDRSEAECC